VGVTNPYLLFVAGRFPRGARDEGAVSDLDVVFVLDQSGLGL